MSSAWRILLIGATPPHRGGVAHFTGMLSTWLRRQHTVTLWGFDPLYPGWLFPGNSTHDPSHTPIACQVDVWLDGTKPWQWWYQFRSIRPGMYDVVIWQWWTPYWMPMLWLLQRATRRAGIPTIAISHQLVEPDAARWQGWLAHWMLRHADGVLFLGNQATMPYTWAKPWRCSPLPLHHAVLSTPLPTRAAARQHLGIAAHANVVLFFGFVRRYKGLDTILQAMQTTTRPFVLVIAGEWWADVRAQLQPLVSHPAIRDRLIIHDRYIPNEAVANYVQAADVLVLPYRSGSVSGVATLAAQVGLPVIASTSGAIAQQVASGATIPAGDSAAWAQALDAFWAQATPGRTPQAVEPSWQFFDQQLSEVWHDITS